MSNRSIKYKNRPYARYRWREKHKKVYTFTKTKFVVGFCLSVFVSIFLGSYIDRYGLLVLKQSSVAVENYFAESKPEQATNSSPPESVLETKTEDPQPEALKRPTLFPAQLLNLEAKPTSNNSENESSKSSNP